MPLLPGRCSCELLRRWYMLLSDTCGWVYHCVGTGGGAVLEDNAANACTASLSVTGG
jgi:hypothetical protein